jgi:hypothetical protein
MTEQSEQAEEARGWQGPEQAGQTPPSAPDEAARSHSFEEPMEDLGRRAEAAGERLGREAQAAGERWSRDPAVVAAGDTAARVWGLLVLAVGLWFFADITLGLEMPALNWREVWPIALIAVGLAVVVRGLASRRA